MKADERKVNAVLRDAESIAFHNESYSGDIVQFPFSISHVYEAVMGAPMGEETGVSPQPYGRQVCDHVLAKVVESAWEGAKGIKGPAILGCFSMALRNHIRDVSLILEQTMKHMLKEFEFDVDPETGYPKCPHCGEPLDTLEADRVTTDECVTLECEELVDGRFEYSYDSMDDGDYGGEVQHKEYACPHCGKQLPEVMQMLIDATS